MDSDRYNHYQQTEQGSPASGNEKLARASFSLSVVALFTNMFLMISLPIGSLALILALLSRGSGRLGGRAKAAVISSVAAIIITCVTTGYAFYTVAHSPRLMYETRQRAIAFLNELGMDTSALQDGKTPYGQRKDGTGQDESDGSRPPSVSDPAEGNGPEQAQPDQGYFYYYEYNDGFGTTPWGQYPGGAYPDPVPSQPSVTGGGDFV